MLIISFDLLMKSFVTIDNKKKFDGQIKILQQLEVEGVKRQEDKEVGA